MLENYPHLQKSRVKAHQRRTKSGKVVQVKEHQDRRSKKNPFDHAKYSFYNKKAEDFWKNNNKENRKKALEGAIPSINAKDWSNDNYENLSPMIRGKLYHYLESKKETPQQDTMKEDEKAVYEDEHKHRPDTMKVGDKVTFKSGGGDMEIIGIRDLFASDLKAYKVKNADGEIFFAEYSKDQLQLSEAKIAHSKGGYVEVGKWYLLNYGKWKDEVKVLSIDSKGMKVYNPKDNWKYSIPMTMIKKKKIGGYMTPIKESVNEGVKNMLKNYKSLAKAKVRSYQRRTKTGKVVQVKEHEDSRQKKSSLDINYANHEVAGSLGYHHRRVKHTLNTKGHEQAKDFHMDKHEENNKSAMEARAKGKHNLALHHSAKSEWHKAQADAHDVMTNYDYHRGKVIPHKDQEKLDHAKNDYDTHRRVIRDSIESQTDSDKTKAGKIQQMMAKEKDKQSKRPGGKQAEDDYQQKAKKSTLKEIEGEGMITLDNYPTLAKSVDRGRGMEKSIET